MYLSERICVLPKDKEEIHMKVNYNVKGKERKALAQAIGQIKETAPVYMGTPSYAYDIDGIILDKEGSIEIDNSSESEYLIERLMDMGFDAEVEVEQPGIVIKVSIDDFDRRQVDNLINLIYSKQKLLNASVGRDAFFVSEGLVNYLREEKDISKESAIEVASRFGEIEGFSFEEDAVLFTGFSEAEGEEVTAYASVAAMIVSHARAHKNIHAKLTEAENEKYAMRIWLNQVGLLGRGGKEIRKTMMKRLSGNAAFRTDESKAKWEENRRAEKCSE